MAFGGLLGSIGAGKGAKTLKKALKFQKQVYGQTKANAQPFIDEGTQAFQTLANEDFRNREFYDYLAGERTRAIRQGQAARGNFLSGAALEAEGRANTELRGAQIDREQNLLLSLAQLGLQGVNTVASAGTGASAAIGNTSANIATLQKTRGELLGSFIDEGLGAAGGAALGFSGVGGLSGNLAGTQQYLTPAGPPSLNPSALGF